MITNTRIPARKRATRWAALGAAAVCVLAACSSSKKSSSSGSTASTAGGAATSASPTTAAAVGNPNGILHYGYDYSAQFTNLDPGKSTGNCDEIVSYPIYDTLVHKDLAGNLQPGLAMSWDVSGTVLTLHLRPNVTFSDGEPFNSDAVKTGLLHNQKNTQYADLGPITSIDTPDPTTVTINYKDNTVIQLVYSFTGEEGMIVAPNAIATASTHPVGAGPFMLTSFNSGATTSVRTNPTYWDKGAYKFGGIDFVQVGTGPPAVTALKAGSVDMIRFEAESYEGLKATPNVGVAAQPTGAYLQFQFRFKPPFDNLMVRQAVAYAINKQQINQVVQDGQGQVADEPYQPQSGSYDPAVAHLYSYDPTKAHQLLVQSGLPLPVKFDMVIPGGNITNMERQGAILQQELNAVGFDVTIKRVLGNDIATGYYIGGQGNVFAAEKLAEPYPPNLLWGAYGKGQFVAKYSSGENAQITNLITQAFSADIATANKLDQQAVDIVMQQALEVPIAFAPQFIAYNNQVVGGTVHGQTNICDHPDLTGVIIKK